MAQLLTPVPTVTAQSTLAGKDPQDVLTETDFWESDDSMAITDVWIKFDFGEQVTLDGFGWSYPSSTKVASTIKVEISDNDSDWTLAEEFSGLAVWRDDLYFATAQTARYFRFTETTLQASHWALWFADFYGEIYVAPAGTAGLKVVGDGQLLRTGG